MNVQEYLSNHCEHFIPEIIIIDDETVDGIKLPKIASSSIAVYGKIGDDHICNVALPEYNFSLCVIREGILNNFTRTRMDDVEKLVNTYPMYTEDGIREYVKFFKSIEVESPYEALN